MVSTKKWSYCLTEKATRELKKLDKTIQKQILDYMDKVIVSPNPRFQGSSLRANLKSYWRYRIGDYRVIGRFEDKILTISVVKIAHRRDVYNTTIH